MENVKTQPSNFNSSAADRTCFLKSSKVIHFLQVLLYIPPSLTLQRLSWVCVIAVGVLFFLCLRLPKSYPFWLVQASGSSFCPTQQAHHNSKRLWCPCHVLLTQSIWDRSQSIQKVYFAKVRDMPVTEPEEVLRHMPKVGQGTAWFMHFRGTSDFNKYM